MVCAFAVSAQTIKVSYKDTASRYGTITRPAGIDMILVASPEASFYYNAHSQYIDSLESTPEGRNVKREMLIASMTQNSEGKLSLDLTKPGAPIKSVKAFVRKTLKNKNLRYYDMFAGNKRYYDETLSEMQWSVTEDSIVTILGYECIMAETYYHGRHWIAWFAPEIPIHDGPWKLRGLPGIILKAESGDFSFMATGIEHFKGKVPGIYDEVKYEECKRQEYLSDYSYYMIHEDEIALAQGIRLKHVDDNGNQVDKPIFDPLVYMLEIDFIK